MTSRPRRAMIAGKNRGESNLPTEEDRKKRALDYLSRDPLLHMGMIRSVRNGSAKLLRVSGKGVLLYNTAGHITMASAADEEEADRIAAACQAGGLCVAHQKFLADRLRERFGFAENRECRQAAYLKRGPIPVPESPAVLRPLDERFLPFVRERYRLEDYGGYLAELLRAGGRAAQGYRDPEGWAILTKRAMECDFSWGRSANEYIRLYRSLLKKG